MGVITAVFHKLGNFLVLNDRFINSVMIAMKAVVHLISFGDTLSIPIALPILSFLQALSTSSLVTLLKAKTASVSGLRSLKLRSFPKPALISRNIDS